MLSNKINQTLKVPLFDCIITANKNSNELFKMSFITNFEIQIHV